MSKPQIVFVPGAWHGPVAFQTVSKKLEDLGYGVHCRQMPSVGNANPPEDLSQDIAALREIVTQAIGDGNDVIVAPHSWAGIVVGSGLTGLGKKQREEKGEKGGVVRCAYICSFIVAEDVSAQDLLPQAEAPDWFSIEGPQLIVKDPDVLYDDLAPAEKQKWFSMLQTHAFATFVAKTTGASWRQIPTSYLLCEEDRALLTSTQELMTNGIKEMGGDIQVERVKGSHSIYLSQPDFLVNWIRRVAGESL